MLLAAFCSLSDDLAMQLHDDLRQVRQAVRDTWPPPGLRCDQELSVYMRGTLKTEFLAGRVAKEHLDLLARDAGYVAWPPVRRRRRPYAAPARPPPEQQQQMGAAAAAADRMAQQLMVRSGCVQAAINHGARREIMTCVTE